MKTILLNNSHDKRFMFLFAVALRLTEKSQSVAEIERLKQQKTIKILKHTLKVKVKKYKLVMQRLLKVRIAIHTESTHRLRRQLEMLMTLKRSIFFEIKELSNKLKGMGVHVSLSVSTFDQFRSTSETKIRKYRIEISKHLQELRWIRTKIVRLYLLFKKHPTQTLKKHLIQLRRRRHELKVVIRLLIVKLHKLGVKGNLMSQFHE